MQEIFNKIQQMPKKNRRVIFSIALLFLVFEAMFIFPLKYELSMINAIMAYCYFMLGVVLCATTRFKSVVVLLGISYANMLGLGLRVWLEWGEYSMSRDLTMVNVLVTYIPIIITVAVGYIHAKQYRKRDKQSA